MSPEACQSQPYTSKSDVWSLGVILYELCTLEYPFAGNNLLSLVNLIVCQKHAPIPKIYSTELSGLIDLLLAKDPKDRPSVREILKMELIRRKAQEFVNSQKSANPMQRSKTVFVKNIPKVKEVKLTPKERLQLKK